LTQSTTPFNMVCEGDEESINEVVHVVLPTHVFRRFVPHDVTTGMTLPATGKEFAIAEQLLTEVFEGNGELNAQVEQLLVESALGVLGEAIKGRAELPQRQTLTERRLQDVLRYIDVHLSDSSLSVAMVARGCGISPRYLSFL